MTNSHGSDLLDSHTMGTADGGAIGRIETVKNLLSNRILQFAIGFLLVFLVPGICRAQTTWVSEFTGMNGGDLNAVASNGTIFAAVGWDFITSGSTQKTGVVYTSSDGVTWTRRDPGTTETLNGIAWQGTKFIAVGDQGNVLNSADGITWTPNDSQTGSNLQGIVWNGLKTITVGESGQIQSSANGTDWTLENSGSTDTLNDIVWSDTQFVVVGETSTTGVILTSPDGVTWTPETPSSNNGLKGVEWNSSKLIAVGAGGRIEKSSDGISWSNQSNSGTTSNTLNDITVRNNSTIVVVGNGGTILVSTNVTTWSKKTSGTTANLQGIIFKGTRFAAVGANGTVLVSDDSNAIATATPTVTSTPTLTPTPTFAVPALDPSRIFLLILLFSLLIGSLNFRRGEDN